MELEVETYTTGMVARVAKVKANTVIQWDLDGLAKPTTAVPEFHTRKYTMMDMVAVSMVPQLLKIGLSRENISQITAAVSRNDQKELECGVIVALTDPGTKHPTVEFFSDITDGEQFALMEKSGFEGRVSEIQTLKEIVDGILAITKEMIAVGAHKPNPPRAV